MLEKDIENLIARYPEEFFPNEGLTLVAQQYVVDGRRFDILFKDKHGRQIIVEVKRGILTREASGQIAEYYGLLKTKNPEEIVELVLCANVILPERRQFLERIGIECKETGVGFITELARRKDYIFLDSESEVAPPINSKTSDNGVWIFQANPGRYDVLNALADEKIGDKVHWLINQNKAKIRKGHIGLIWMSGKDAGIYAVTKINTDPGLMKEFDAEAKYWIGEGEYPGEKLRVEMTVVKRMLNKPIFKRDLLQIPELRKLSILNRFQGTNFPVTDSEWDVLSKIINWA